MRTTSAASSASRKTTTRNQVVAAFAVLTLIGCGGGQQGHPAAPDQAADRPPFRLEARPHVRAKPCAPGEYELRISPDRRALVRVTPQRPGRRPALLLALHGAGSGGAPGGLYAFRGAWSVPGLVILAPAAAGTAWSFSEIDVGFVDRALQRAFARCKIDPRRVAVGGFSSGAGMALWLGLANGDLFRSVIVLSGGGTLPDERTGKPRVFVAHGTRDDVIPIRLGGDAIVRELRSAGYEIAYRRFRGGHRVVPSIARAAVVSTLVR